LFEKEKGESCMEKSVREVGRRRVRGREIENRKGIEHDL